MKVSGDTVSVVGAKREGECLRLKIILSEEDFLINKQSGGLVFSEVFL